MDASKVAEIPGIVLVMIWLVGSLLVISGVLVFIAKYTGGEDTNVTN